MIRIPGRITALISFADAAVELGNLRNPASPLPMLHPHHFGLAPMKVKCDKGYLLVELIEGIADYPPKRASSGTNSWWQDGQIAWGRSSSRLLIRL
jgi:hypothetical protein